ncbi:TetR/AcrR family transcriptional regulator [Acinetobacter soli]|uniref:TetR family transcriptional regulator n=1 Tax=Acinetobacter soli TaxID=487316 RepID=A0A1P8EN95_9GAMM|nr:TetR/AcrR family transcriptional regulator [Acinetobacter soli]APV37676.1 TetR family transcriptional regulator [Acinetobacter soli]
MTLENPFLNQEKKEQERKAKRDAVLLAAVKIFNQQGFHSTSLDDVAQSLGISKPTIYHYLGNKEQVLLTCVEIGLQQLIEAAKDVEKQSISGFEKLRRFLFLYGCRNLDDFGRCVILTSDDALSKEGLAKFRALKRIVHQALLKIIQDAQADQSIRAEHDAKILAATLTGAINWSAKWYDPQGALSKKETVQKMVDILTYGFEKK